MLKKIKNVKKTHEDIELDPKKRHANHPYNIERTHSL